VIANPVRVAPIPKVIAHVPTNIIITTSGVGLSLIKVAMPNAVMWVARNAKARPTAPIAVWLVASSSSEGLINADRFLGRKGLASDMSCVFADNCSIKDNRTVTTKTFFSLAFDTRSAADHSSELSSANRLR
jgi:hypothetical protein